jgi:hypothetical protein
MFEFEKNLNPKDKKRKALILAGLITFIIAMLYVVLHKGKLYDFNGVGKDIAPVSSFIKDASVTVSEDISNGTEVINKNK